MGDYRIVTDSTTDLPQNLVDDMDITVIPMDFKLGENSYRDYPDEHELSSHEFYTRIAAEEEASTTQIGITVFADTFERYLKEGLDVLYIGFSSGLSGTYNNSVIAAKELREKYPERKIITVDSLSASMGEGLVVYYAVMQKRSGAKIDEAAAWVENNRNRLHHWFTVDDLNHLKRGGRISGTSALVGTMLGIKPVLHFDDRGHIIFMQKIRGRRQSLDTLIKHMEKTSENPGQQTIFISHSDSLESAEYVARQVKSKFGVGKIEIAPIGPVIGVHTGTGTVALFYLGKDRDFKEQ